MYSPYFVRIKRNVSKPTCKSVGILKKKWLHVRQNYFSGCLVPSPISHQVSFYNSVTLSLGNDTCTSFPVKCAQYRLITPIEGAVYFLPLRKNLLGLKRKANNYYFTF